MTSLYFGQHARLKSYGATTKGEKTIVKIEVESSDNYEVAGLLNDLRAMQAVQKPAAKAKRLAIPDLREVK